MIRNFFTLIGVIVFLSFMAFSIKYYSVLSEFHPKSLSVYVNMFGKLLENGNAAEAMVWKKKIENDISFIEAEEVIRLVANEYNIKNVGELPLYKEIEAITEEPHRIIKIYMFCDPLTASKMVEYSEAFSAYLPCRIALVEDKHGGLWLYTLNMDLMIYGGKPLPKELYKEAIVVKETLLAIMQRTAAGEF